MRLSLVWTAAWNLIRMPFETLFSGFKIKSSIIQLISPHTELDASCGGYIQLIGRVHSERGVLLSSRNGTLIIGNLVYINRNSMIVCRELISISNGVTIGPNVTIYDHDHDFHCKGNLSTAPVQIGENAWIGAGCTILKGVSIGSNSVIAAGTVVAKDVPSNTIFRSHFEYKTKEIE